ncbi:MAG: phosphoribosylglycinamide formyltransferase [Bacteroidales bacterium]|nr:phosphoribosylglycinamide formyltransferase [Bacteroidales bacterium]
MQNKKINLAIFASGSGTNAENIVKYFLNDDIISVHSVFTNNPKAGVIERMKTYNIPMIIFNKDEFHSKQFLSLLYQLNIDVIILAGFLWLIPENIIVNFPDRIINIHPALLPAYGGKGMYGNNVHKKVIDNKETKSGITIHLVNKDYDKGKILFQAVCHVYPNDTVDTLANRVHLLEYTHFPSIIKAFVLTR